jgi:hypothetical protein
MWLVAPVSRTHVLVSRSPSSRWASTFYSFSWIRALATPADALATEDGDGWIRAPAAPDDATPAPATEDGEDGSGGGLI